MIRSKTDVEKKGKKQNAGIEYNSNQSVMLKKRTNVAIVPTAHYP